MSTDESIGAELRVESPFESLLASLHENANVRRVYGDPVVHGERTVVPVARVAYGFGGGAGEGGEEEDGSGFGAGGGLTATPVGALELSDEGTRFVRFDDRRSLVGAVALGLAAGYLLARRGRSSPPSRRDRIAGRARGARQMAVRRARSAPAAARRRARRGATKRVGSVGERVRAVRRSE